MKRLLCIVSSLDVGGAETFLMKIFRNLPVEYKMDFIVSKNSGFYENEVNNMGGKVYRVPLRTKHPILSFNDIRKIIKENNYQYILKVCDTPIGFFDLLAAKLGGASKLCVRSCNANTNESVTRKILNILLRPAFNRISDIKIAPSRLAAEFTYGKNEVNKGGIIFLNNGLNLNEYKYYEKDRIEIRSKLGINNKIVLGHIGRFTFQKNHDFLIKLFSECILRYPNSVLLLIGEGELESKIKHQIMKMGIEDKVILLGLRKDIPQLLSAMDAFILPSFYEGMPNTVIEAQATGLKCIISDTITQEANITGKVKYCSLESNYEDWINLIYEDSIQNRNNVHSSIIAMQYDIESVTNKFISCIFK